MTVPKCSSWRGHRFEPRYSVHPTNLWSKQIDELFWLGYEDRKRLTQPSRNYECDVCVRCGHVVQPTKETENGR